MIIPTNILNSTEFDIELHHHEVDMYQEASVLKVQRQLLEFCLNIVLLDKFCLYQIYVHKKPSPR